MTTRDSLKALWQRAFGEDRAVSGELSALVPAVCEEVERCPTNRLALRTSLETLLGFLSSREGRTDANCRAVDSFFCSPQDHGWEVDWGHVPGEFQGILGDLGGTLHDTVAAPDIAQNFESTPEQLLDRVLRIGL